MAEQHTLTIKAELDTSGIQGKLDQLNQQKQSAAGGRGGVGTALTSQLTRLDRTLASLAKAVNQLAAGQKQANGAVATSSARPVVVNAGGRGFGPAVIPQISGRTVQQSLMRDAVASIARNVRRTFDAHTGDVAGLDKFGIRKRAQELVVGAGRTGIANDPAGWYRDIFFQRGAGIPMSTKLRMLNQAPLAALGIGPRSWRAAQLAPRRITKIPSSLYGGAAGFVAGRMLSPALDYVANEVYKDPTSGGRFWSNVGRHAVDYAAGGAATGGMIGAAFGGVGAAPGAAIGAVLGGIAGAFSGVFDTLTQIKEDEARTAEEIKRRNEQIRANWKKVEEALPKAQQSIQFRRSAELTSQLASMADTTAVRRMRGPLVDRLGVMRGERALLENRILEFRKSGNMSQDTGRAAGLMKKLDELNARISNEEANLRVIDAAIEADDANAAAEERLRDEMLKTVGTLQARQALAGEGRQVGLLAQFGTRGQLEEALSEYGARMRLAVADRDQAAAEMKAAAEDGREEAFDEAKERYQTQLSLLDALAGFRGSLGQALSQMIATQMPSYTGLQASQLGQLAAIGGFGSASALADPSLELTRQQVDLLREILRKIPEETAALYN